MKGRLAGFNIPHAECYSLAEYLRVGNLYRPSIHYSYLPSDTCKLINTYGLFGLDNNKLPKSYTVLRND